MSRASSTETCDVAIVGGGIVGLAVARELQRRGLRDVVVLEREDAVGRHQTGHSSGVVHAGLYYAPGSLKAEACVRGRELLERYCGERGIAFERCGKLVIARSREELERLAALERRAVANGVPGLRRLDGAAAIREVEPHATGRAALHSPATAICDFGAVARSLATEVEADGGRVITGFDVRTIRREGGASPFSLLTSATETVQARRVVGCAGLWSDRLARADGGDPSPRIVPFRGGYLRLTPDAQPLVRGLIYPVPDPSLPFLGVHLTRTTAGELWLGPTALLVGRRAGYRLRSAWRPGDRDLRETLGWPGTWRVARRWWRTGLDELATAARPQRLLRAAAEYVPDLRPEHVARGPHPSGVRAQAVDRDGALVDDFLIERTPSGFHVRNAPSPAATSSLALAERIADRVVTSA